MERIKFEETSREKFEERELQPSEGAWAKLEAMLEEEQPQKKGGGFRWLAIAASFIGLVIIASIFFNQTSTKGRLVIEEEASQVLKKKQNNTPFKTVTEINKEQEAVAETTKIEEEKQLDKTSKNNIINTSVTSKNDVASVSEKGEGNITVTKSGNNTPLQKTQQNKNMSGGIAMAGKEGNASQISEEKNSPLRLNKEAQLIPNGNKKVPAQNELLAMVGKTKNTPLEITNEEIDALLSNAQRAIQKQQLLKLNTGKIDAMALLNDVEMDAERSLREKLFLALGDSYDYVKTSVANRNN